MATQKIVKLPNANWVNPDHVTAIEVKGNSVTVWCKMHAGYGTGRAYISEHSTRAFAQKHAEQIARLINEPATT